MVPERLSGEEDSLRHARDVFIHLGFLVLLVGSCLLILRPFIPLITWGITIAIAIYPAYRKVVSVLGGRRNLAAVVCTIILLVLLIVPVALLAGTLVDGIQSLAARAKQGIPLIPPPPSGVENWPVVGKSLSETWTLASVNLSAAVKTFAPQIKAFIPNVLSASAGIGMAGLQLTLSIIVAGVLLATAKSASRAAEIFFDKLFGRKGPEFAQLAESTVRSVATGIIGVALIQSLFAAIGFLIFGLPAAGLWAIIFLVAAILQVGALTLIPAVIYMFATASTTKAVLFLIWCAIVGISDNILKPLLLGRGVAVPIVIVFLGAIGGFLALGIIGLFVGAIVLSVGYKLFLGWLEGPSATDAAA
jgi:predicted PurR-regulated permease PerM